MNKDEEEEESFQIETIHKLEHLTKLRPKRVNVRRPTIKHLQTKNELEIVEVSSPGNNEVKTQPELTTEQQLKLF